MTPLPPPRLPDQPPDRPPIRRPDEHLPRPDDLAIRIAQPPVESPKRRPALLIAAIAVFVAIGAGLFVGLAGSGGDDALDTAAAAERVDDALRDSDNSGREPGCPVDEFDDTLAAALESVGSDELFDTIDLGSRQVNKSIEGEEAATTFVSCNIYSTRAGEYSTIALSLSGDGEDYDRFLRENEADGEEFEEGDAFRGGMISFDTLRDDTSDAGLIRVSWTDEHLGVSITLGVSDVDDIDREALQTGLETVLPQIVEQLTED